MATTQWSAYDEGYLRAYQWASSLAGGAALPQEQATIQLGPGEVVHAHLAPVTIVGYYGENAQYRRSFLLLGGPVGWAVTGAASVAYNQSQKRKAQQAAVPRWHQLGAADVVLTSQRIVITRGAQAESLWFAEIGAPQWTTGPGGVPAVQVQAPGMPVLRLESPWAPLLYVFAHQIVDGHPPGVPLPEGLLDRARAEGRLSA
ncbi:MAG TPA: hypothetical protein VMT10_08605 [Solirubrobacteraceae bacterium]|nr:hypothetical protein [Solirubrobacteraceae bacterium]